MTKPRLSMKGKQIIKVFSIVILIAIGFAFMLFRNINQNQIAAPLSTNALIENGVIISLTEPIHENIVWLEIFNETNEVIGISYPIFYPTLRLNHFQDRDNIWVNVPYEDGVVWDGILLPYKQIYPNEAHTLNVNLSLFSKQLITGQLYRFVLGVQQINYLYSFPIHDLVVEFYAP